MYCDARCKRFVFKTHAANEKYFNIGKGIEAYDWSHRDVVTKLK